MTRARQAAIATIASVAVLPACAPDTDRRNPVIGAAREATTALPPGELAYVTNEDSHDLTVIATANDSVVATIPVPTNSM